MPRKVSSSNHKPLDRPMPVHCAGVVIPVPLERYPEYMRLNGLEPDGMKIGILHVKKTGEENEPGPGPLDCV